MADKKFLFWNIIENLVIIVLLMISIIFCVFLSLVYFKYNYISTYQFPLFINKQHI